MKLITGGFMKTFNQLLVTTLVTLLAFGCAKSASSQSPTAEQQPVVPPVIVDPNTLDNSYLYSNGATTDFKPTSLAVMNDYVATHPLNNPSQFKVNINLSQAQNGRYGGAVSVSYIDNGQQYNGVFKSGLGKNQSFKGMYDNDALESEYNYWFNFNKQLVFTGVFEDQYGAITLTLVPTDPAASVGNDAEPIQNTNYKGYIYYKNFTVTTAPHTPYRSCWFTYKGPYDCRSNVIQTKCGLYPGAEAGYKLLGTFDVIDTKKAFNIQ
jgi:hypothetical protein